MKTAGGVDGFRTECSDPGCRGPLMLISMSVTCRIPIQSDGFSTTDAEFFDTYDEVVKCGDCGRLSDLLYLEDSPNVFNLR